MTSPRPTLASVALLHGAYWALTGVWPLVHMASFLAVSGPKHDLWLVRTLGVLIGVVGVTLLLAGWRRRVTPEIVVLAVGGALGLTAIDVVYSLKGVIWKTYLLDAAAEVVLVLLWAWAGRRARGDG
jgi:hypothetical protein